MRSLALFLELRRWRRAGRTARLWWRDDDAAGRTARLDRLLLVAWASKTPLTLAVVPAGDMTGLQALLELRLATETGRITLAQHGVDHQNRRGGPAAGEFPHDWSRDEVAAALRRGWSLIKGMPRVEPLYVPPWNDVHPQLDAALGACGYEGWSVNGALAQSSVTGGVMRGGHPDGRLPRVDVHLDLLRWRGGARFRGQGLFLKALAAELRRRREAQLWSAPIGLLTHHLAHDAAAWDFLERFLDWSTRRPEFTWAALPDLIAEAAVSRAANDRATPLGRAPGPSLASSSP